MTSFDYPLAYQIVDAFSAGPFTGNPASVIIFDEQDPRGRDDSLLQKLAIEFNHAETAFVVPEPGNSATEPKYLIRWFTPGAEIALCGHATLASAHTLFTTLHPKADKITFSTRFSGILVASKQGDKIGLDFPAEQSVLDAPLVTDGAKFDSLVKALAAAAPGVEKHIVAAGWSGWGPTVELDTQVDLKGLKVDVSHFTADISSSMVILTQPAPAESDNDVYSRVFAPAVGVDEDPVTGAAHTILGPYWLGSAARKRLLSPAFASAETNLLKARQVSPRGGNIDVTWHKETGRIDLVGQGVTTMAGEVIKPAKKAAGEGIEFHTFDAFTSDLFSGNPAAFVLFPEGSEAFEDAAYLMKLAVEFNLPNSAFVSPIASESTDSTPIYAIRYWSRSSEVTLCGHASLATTSALLTLYHPNSSSIHFKTRLSGDVIGKKTADGRFALDFPEDQQVVSGLWDLTTSGEKLEKVLQAVVKSAEGQLTTEQIVGGAWSKLGPIVELSDDVDLANLDVSPSGFLAFDAKMFIFTQASTSAHYDIHTRVFSPFLGSPEDPVCGAAHCSLAPYWLKTPLAQSRLPNASATETSVLRSHQVSARGGQLEVTLRAEEQRVELKGKVVHVGSGRLL